MLEVQTMPEHFLKRRKADEATLGRGDYVIVRCEPLYVFRYTGSTEGGIWVGRKQANLRALVHNMHGHVIGGRVVKERDALGHYMVEVDRLMTPRGAVSTGGMMAWRVLAHESECSGAADMGSMLAMIEGERERARLNSGHPSMRA